VRHNGGGRRDVGRDRQRNRRDNARDVRRDVRSERREFARDVHDERHEWWEHRRRRSVGTAITVTAFRSLTCTPTVVVVGQVAYYNCDEIWYSRRYVGGNVTYVIVTSPPGY
jgi:hypothetical protein